MVRVDIMSEYILDVSVTQFGNLYDSSDALIGINAFKDWVRTSTNDLLSVNIKYVYTTDLITLSELTLGTNCYYFDPSHMTAAHKSLIPANCSVNFILWNNQSYNPCQGGSDYGNDGGTSLQMWDTIPINNWWNTSYNADICSYSLNGIMSHEFLNMMNDILHTYLGFSDVLSDYGMPIPECGSQCTAICRTTRMSKLTQQMCESMISYGYAIIRTLTTISLSPTSASVVKNGTQQFSATCKDQNGNQITPCPSLTWDTTDHTLGTVTSSGLFTAGSPTTLPATVTVKATSETIVGSAVVTITAMIPPTPSSNTGITAVALIGISFLAIVMTRNKE